MLNLAKLDPRTKIIMIIAISTAAMVVKNIWMQLGLLCFTVLILAIGGVNLRRQLSQAKIAVGMVLFLFLLQAIFGRAELGALLSVRLLIIIMSALLLLTGEARDYLLGLVQWKIPYEIAYMVIIGLHFFPILKEEALDVYYSIQLRGTELQKASLKKKLSAYLKLSLPILAGAMERAKDTSISMEARSFRAYPKRTYMRKLKLKARDVILMVLFPILAAGFILCGCGSRIEPPSQIILSQTETPAVSQGISWYGEKRYDGVIQYGEKELKEEMKVSVAEVRPHEYYRYKAVIKDLKPDTTYSYRVGDGRTWSETKSFKTEGNGSFSCLYMGDVQYQVRSEDYKQWGSLLQRAYQQKPEIAMGIFGGDMVEKSGDVQDWKAFFSAGQPVFSKVPMATVPGNHETSIIPYTYLQMLPVPQKGPVKGEVYSFDYGDCHFVMLNSCLFMEERIHELGESQWKKMIASVNQWIAKDLSASHAKWKVAVMHHPPYPIAEDDELYSRLRDNWTPVLEHGNIDLVLCGHQHVYMRTDDINGITYIMGNSGQKQSYYYKDSEKLPSYVKKLERKTGTYQILTVTDKSLKVEAFDEKGSRFDTWSKGT